MTSEHLNRSDNETVPAHKTAFPSSWFAIVKGIWPGPLSSNDTAYSTKKTSQNDDESEAICTRLASLLQKRISSSELSPTNKEGYSNVPHCHQLESWDCGIACLLMVLRWLSPKRYKYSSQMLPHEKRKRQGLMQDIDSESIWTADIVLQLDFLLETHKADYVFCTKTFAVDDAYIDVGYYRASFGVDKKRVEIAFSQLLAQRGKNLFSTSHLPLTLVLNAVCSPNCIAIVLLDNHILYAKDTDMNGEDQYSGHYVILSGISRATEDIATAHIQDGSSGQDKEDFCVVLANPGNRTTPIMHVTPSRFERSWRASGTDNDIIFVIRQ